MDEEKLPKGWSKHFSKRTQCEYYFNCETGETSWYSPVNDAGEGTSSSRQSSTSATNPAPVLPSTRTPAQDRLKRLQTNLKRKNKKTSGPIPSTSKSSKKDSKGNSSKAEDPREPVASTSRAGASEQSDTKSQKQQKDGEAPNSPKKSLVKATGQGQSEVKKNNLKRRLEESNDNCKAVGSKVQKSEPTSKNDSEIFKIPTTPVKYATVGRSGGSPKSNAVAVSSRSRYGHSPRVSTASKSKSKDPVPSSSIPSSTDAVIVRTSPNATATITKSSYSEPSTTTASTLCKSSTSVQSTLSKPNSTTISAAPTPHPVRSNSSQRLSANERLQRLQNSLQNSTNNQAKTICPPKLNVSIDSAIEQPKGAFGEGTSSHIEQRRSCGDVEPMDWSPSVEEDTTDFSDPETETTSNDTCGDYYDVVEKNLLRLSAESTSMNGTYIKTNFHFVVDTNVFLHDLSFLKDLTKMKLPGSADAILIVPYCVLQELDKLKSRDESVSTLAIRAIRYLNEEMTAPESSVSGQSATEARKHLIDIESADDSIINCCLQLKEKVNHVFLLSNDVNLQNKAISNDIRVTTKSDLENADSHF